MKKYISLEEQKNELKTDFIQKNLKLSEKFNLKLKQIINNQKKIKTDLFFKHYTKLNNKTLQLEFVLQVIDKGLDYQNDIFNKLSNIKLPKAHSEVNGSELISNFNKFISIAKKGNKTLENFNIKIPFAKSAFAVSELVLGATQFNQIYNSSTQNPEFDKNSIKNQELLLLLSAIGSDNNDTINVFYNYHKFLGDFKGFINSETTIAEYKSNLCQAMIGYLNLSPEFQKNLEFLPLHKLVPLLNSPFIDNSLKFSFDENATYIQNMFTPETFNKKNKIYENFVVSTFHTLNILDIKNNLKPTNPLSNVSIDELINLYKQNKLPLSSMETDIEKGILDKHQCFINEFEKQIQINLNLYSRYQNKKTNVLNKDVSNFPKNKIVISSFINAHERLDSCKELSLTMNIKPEAFQCLYKMTIISQKLLEHLQNSSHAQNPDAYTLINHKLLNEHTLNNLDIKFLLNENLLAEKINIFNETKTFSDFMSEIGSLKRQLKYLIKSSLDSNEIKKEFNDQLDAGIDKLFINFSHKKTNNSVENVILQNSLLESNENLKQKLNDYNQLIQKDLTLSKVATKGGLKINEGFDVISDYVTNLAKRISLEDTFVNNLSHNPRDTFPESSPLIAHIHHITTHSNLLTKQKFNHDTHKELVIDGVLVPSVLQRIKDISNVLNKENQKNNEQINSKKP